MHYALLHQMRGALRYYYSDLCYYGVSFLLYLSAIINSPGGFLGLYVGWTNYDCELHVRIPASSIPCCTLTEA